MDAVGWARHYLVAYRKGDAREASDLYTDAVYALRVWGYPEMAKFERLARQGASALRLGSITAVTAPARSRVRDLLTEPERLRWPVARLLNRLPWTCWANLVSWAIDGRRDSLVSSFEVAACRQEGRESNCYCAKFATCEVRKAINAGGQAPASPALPADDPWYVPGPDGK